MVIKGLMHIPMVVVGIAILLQDRWLLSQYAPRFHIFYAPVWSWSELRIFRVVLDEEYLPIFHPLNVSLRTPLTHHGTVGTRANLSDGGTMFDSYYSVTSSRTFCRAGHGNPCTAYLYCEDLGIYVN